jgi:hypothetical protein
MFIRLLLILNKARFRRASLVLSLAVVSFVLWSCEQESAPNAPSSPLPSSIAPALSQTDWSGQPAFIQQAIAVQGRLEASLLAMPGVIGDGVGLDPTNANAAVILVFTSRAGVEGIPASFEGITLQTTMVGTVTAHAFTGTYRSPLPCGVTVGDNTICAAGSIGAIVTSTRTSSGSSTYGGSLAVYYNQYSWPLKTPKYLLSCNHVLANENSATGPDQQDQPGRVDVSCGTSGAVGKLHAWNFINHAKNTTNYYDAALAECNPGLSGGWSPAMMSNASKSPYLLSYIPTNSPVAPSLGMVIKKTGRTSGYNTATIAGINVTITIAYTNFTAVFIDQIYVASGSYIQAGDSGSMSVVNSGVSNNNDPVGLNFAGSSTSGFMNRMDHIAHDFGLTFVQSSF